MKLQRRTKTRQDGIPMSLSRLHHNILHNTRVTKHTEIKKETGENLKLHLPPSNIQIKLMIRNTQTY